MKKLLNISLWVLLAALLMVGLGFAWKQQKKNTVKDISIHINHQGSDALISKTEIEKAIGGVHKKILGLKTSQIQIKKIENTLQSIPFVAKADVYLSLDGHLSIEILQRIPLARIQNKTGDQSFIDIDGNIFPLSRRHSARVLVISGHIETPLKTGMNVMDTTIRNLGVKRLKTSFIIAREIYAHPGLSAMIGQLYIDEQGEVELFTITANHTIVFGDETNASDKFARLWLFYKRALPAKGWNTYRIINLKYNNQVVCTK